MLETAVTWTLVVTTAGGWGTPTPSMQPGFRTEEACKEAAHKFMDYRDNWFQKGWYAKEGYRSPKCIEVK